MDIRVTDVTWAGARTVLFTSMENAESCFQAATENPGTLFAVLVNGLTPVKTYTSKSAKELEPTAWNE